MDEEEVVKNIAHRAKNDGIFVGWEFCKNDCPFILIAEKRKEKAYILTTKTTNEGFFALEGYRKQSDTAREILKPLYDCIIEHSNCCVNLSEDIKFLIEKYGVEVEE